MEKKSLNHIIKIFLGKLKQFATKLFYTLYLTLGPLYFLKIHIMAGPNSTKKKNFRADK